MNKIRVLMIGPGTPSEHTSGLGVAAHHISNNLAGKVDLTLIQPGQTPELQEVENIVLSTTETFSEENIVTEIIRMNISGISEWSYLGGEEVETVDEYHQSKVQHRLTLYSQEILRKSEEKPFDLIYAHDWTSLKAALALKEKTGKPLIIHFHSLDFDRMAGKDRSWIHDLESEAIQKADALITVSHYSSNVLKKHYQVPGDRIHPIHNGLESFRKRKIVKNVKEDIILFVGRLTEQKGPGHFLEIAEEIHSRNPETRFVMVGKGEKQKEILESGAYQSFAHKFHLTGYIEPQKLQEFYSISSVYCMPSISEPFGLSAIEAAHAGLPMVLSKQSGAAEVLKGSMTANYWEIKEFADKILYLLENKKASKKMVEENRLCLSTLSWDKTADQIIKVFNSVLDR